MVRLCGIFLCHYRTSGYNFMRINGLGMTAIWEF